MEMAKIWKKIQDGFVRNVKTSLAQIQVLKIYLLRAIQFQLYSLSTRVPQGFLKGSSGVSWFLKSSLIGKPTCLMVQPEEQTEKSP